MTDLTPELLLHAYRSGCFPMADPDEEYAIYWYAPDPRAILPLEAFHVPDTLAKLVRQRRFEITTDQAFSEVIQACAAPRPGRRQTWISPEIATAYHRLHELGHAHTIECRRNGRLVGGLYGVAVGAAFFGESMFHEERDASKVALVHLVEQLRRGGFVLLDVQFSTPHLARFGVVEVPRRRYEALLVEALGREADWNTGPIA